MCGVSQTSGAVPVPREACGCCEESAPRGHEWGEREEGGRTAKSAARERPCWLVESSGLSASRSSRTCRKGLKSVDEHVETSRPQDERDEE